MDGLECSEIMCSQLERTKRIDSEYYKKYSLTILHRMNSLHGQPITDYVNVSDGNHMGISDHFTTKGIPYYRGQDIHEFFIEDSNPICIDEKAYESPYMKRSYLHKGDVLVSIVGTIGKVSIVSKSEKATCNCKLAILRPHSQEDAPLIAIYLRSKYGSDQIKKSERGSVQKGFLLEDMDQILIPSFSHTFSKAINSAVKRVYTLKRNSNEEYKKAEHFLLQQLNVNTTILSSNNTFVRSLSESFEITGRLDAEYYEPRNYELINLLNGNESIGSSCDIDDDNYQPDNNSQYKYIELANIGEAGEIIGVESKMGASLPTRARRLVHTGDVIVSSIEGSLQSCALITSEYNNALCSTGFYVLNSSKYNSETLLVLLKSGPIQSLLKRGCSGTILTSISKDELMKIPLPAVSDDIQQTIKNKISKVYILRDHSKALLNATEKAVEIAVEQSEEEAITWLNNKTLEIEASK